ncbi:MAG: O-acetyl-ADP-ribose deacetylase [bacterium]|nr:O-acetyl-ADP-ribose deacetylase [bacterium]
MPESTKIHDSKITVDKGDITQYQVQAFVFYAQHDLQLGTGFGTAVSQRGGPKIQEELDPLAPVETTAVVISGAGALHADHILHAVGPRFQEEDMAGKLRATVLNCLREADALGVTSLALPAMGAGFYGVPLPMCATVTLTAVRDYLCQQTGLESVVLCVLDSREYEVFAKQLTSLADAKATA